MQGACVFGPLFVACPDFKTWNCKWRARAHKEVAQPKLCIGHSYIDRISDLFLFCKITNHIITHYCIRVIVVLHSMSGTLKDSSW